MLHIKEQGKMKNNVTMNQKLLNIYSIFLNTTSNDSKKCERHQQNTVKEYTNQYITDGWLHKELYWDRSYPQIAYSNIYDLYVWWPNYPYFKYMKDMYDYCMHPVMDFF